MKRILYILSVVCLMATASCDNREEVQGQWSTHNTGIDVPGATVSNSTMVMTFSQDGKTAISTDIDILESIGNLTDTETPIQVGLKANVSIDGTWEYVSGEDDEVMLTLNDQSFNVKVDPKSVTVSPAPEDPAEMSTLQQTVSYKYNAILTNQMRAYFGRFNKLEDIKVTKGTTSTMEFDVDMPSGEDITYSMKMI